MPYQWTEKGRKQTLTHSRFFRVINILEKQLNVSTSPGIEIWAPSPSSLSSSHPRLVFRPLPKWHDRHLSWPALENISFCGGVACHRENKKRKGNPLHLI